MATRFALLGASPATVPAVEPPDWSAVVQRPAADRARPAVLDWDEQMRQHGRKVVVALVARGVPVERAKELAQEAWIRVIQNHRAGRLVELRIPGVVIAQADFLARDDRRRSGRRSLHAVEPPAGIDPDANPAPTDLEQRLVARQQLRKIAAVVERASPNARRVFFMMYGGNARPAAEIAAELGLSVQRVRQIACELRKRIRQELGGHDDARA